MKKLCIGMLLTASTHHVGNVAVEEQIAFAQRAEAAHIDFVFRADYLGAKPELIAKSKGNVAVDPLFLMGAVAQATTHIGLVTTVSTSFNPPYIIARQLQSLHWLSNGRMGWNIVTSIDGAENFSAQAMPPSEERYRKAAECTEVVRKLWQSYPYEALTAESDIAKIKALVQPIHHHGEFFDVTGPLNVPAHPSGEMPFFQAGASEAGRNFAASIAHGVFAATPHPSIGKELRLDLRARAIAQGRDPNTVRLLPGVYFFIGDTTEEAQEMYREAHAYLTTERRLDFLKMTIAADLSHLALTDKVTLALLPAEDAPVRSKTHAKLLRSYVAMHEPTLEELLARPEVIGAAHWVVMGTAEQVAKQISEAFYDGALDGFIAVPGGPAKSLDLFFDKVLPLFVAQGIFKSQYEGATLRAHLGLQ